jgi:hypothetical protein
MPSDDTQPALLPVTRDRLYASAREGLVPHADLEPETEPGSIVVENPAISRAFSTRGLVELVSSRMIRLGFASIPVVGPAIDHLGYGSRDDSDLQRMSRQISRLSERIAQLERGRASDAEQLTRLALTTPEAQALRDILVQLKDHDWGLALDLIVGWGREANRRIGVSEDPYEATLEPGEFLQMIERTDRALAREIETLRAGLASPSRSALTHRNARMFLRIARSVQREMALDAAYGCNRSWCIDSNVAISAAEGARGGSDPDQGACFSIYFAIAKPPLPIVLAAPQAEKITEYLSLIIKHAQKDPTRAPRALAAYDFLKAFPKAGTIAESDFRGVPVELRHRFAEHFWLDRGGVRHHRNREQTQRLADTLALLTHQNSCDQVGRRHTTFVTTSEAITARDGKGLLVQHVYATAWRTATAKIGSCSDDRLVELATALLARLPTYLEEQERQVGIRKAADMHVELSDVSLIVERFHDSLRPFHEEVASTVDQERGQRCDRFREWIKAVAEGRTLILDLTKRLRERVAEFSEAEDPTERSTTE